MSEIPRCEVCGEDGTLRPLSGFHSIRESWIRCELCLGLIEAGLIRPETVDGERRFRQWHIGEWTPGDLLPKTQSR